MNRFLPAAGITLLIVLTFACSTKKKHQSTATIGLVKKDTARNISIRFAGSVTFRRTFADIQFLTSEKEIDQYMKKQEISAPEILYGENDTLRKQLGRFDFVKGDRFFLKKFKYSIRKNCRYIDNSGRPINIHFTYPPENEEIWINVLSGNDSAKIKIDGLLFYLKYSLLDIIPGGNKEIVLLHEYHIMNGDNFEIMIYEIKTKE